MICSRPNDQVGRRTSQYPVSADATSPATRIATPIPAEPTVVQRITRRSRARGSAARYRCEAYHPPTAITTISPIISTSTAQTTGCTYPALNVVNKAQEGSLRVDVPVTCPIGKSGPVSDGHSRTTTDGGCPALPSRCRSSGRGSLVLLQAKGRTRPTWSTRNAAMLFLFCRFRRTGLHAHQLSSRTHGAATRHPDR